MDSVTNIHPDNRPLTIPEMLGLLKSAAERGELENLLSGLDHVRMSVESAIERKRPGWTIDRLLGLVSKDWKEGKRND